MAAVPSKMTLKLLIDKKSNKVLFAEATKEVVDFICSIPTLPVGTVTKLLSDNEEEGMVGCLSNLYQSIENLNDYYMTSSPLTKCPTCTSFLTSELTKLDGRTTAKTAAPIFCEGGFVKGEITYMVLDDLSVLPSSALAGISIMKNFNVDVRSIEENVVYLDMAMGLKLLKKSFQTKNVLTEVFLKGQDNMGRHMFISKLKMGRCAQRLTCRVSRLWKAFNRKRNGELISMDFIAIDQKEDVIFCSVKSRHVPDFEGLLEEGSVYLIKNYVVTPWDKSYRVLHDIEHYLLFDGSTTAVKIIDNIPPIIHHKFNLIPYMNLERVGENRIRLCDVIGYATSVSDVGERMKDDVVYKIQYVELMDANGGTIKLTVWGEELTRTIAEMLSSGNHVWVVTSTIVKREGGAVSISTSSATKIYGSLEIQEIDEFLSSMTVDIEHTTIKRTAINSKYITRSDYGKANRTIAQVLEMLARNEKMVGSLYVYGAIASIGEQNGWKYNSCSGCRKKVVYQGGKYFCDRCVKYEDFPTVRYRLEVIIGDERGSLNCVIFDKEVEGIVNICAPDLARVVVQEDSDDAIPRQIRRIIGKCFIYQLRHNRFGRSSQVNNFIIGRIVNESDIMSDPEKSTTSVSVATSPPLSVVTPSLAEKRRRGGTGSSEDVEQPDEGKETSEATVVDATVKGRSKKKAKRQLDYIDSK